MQAKTKPGQKGKKKKEKKKKNTLASEASQNQKAKLMRQNPHREKVNPKPKPKPSSRAQTKESRKERQRRRGGKNTKHHYRNHNTPKKQNVIRAANMTLSLFFLVLILATIVLMPGTLLALFAILRLIFWSIWRCPIKSSLTA